MTGTQVFWGVCAVVGLVAVGYPSAHVGGMDTMIADLTHGWGGITVSLDLIFIAIPVVAFMRSAGWGRGRRSERWASNSLHDP